MSVLSLTPDDIDLTRSFVRKTVTSSVTHLQVLPQGRERLWGGREDEQDGDAWELPDTERCQGMRW